MPQSFVFCICERTLTIYMKARKTLFPTSGSKKSARSLDDLMLSLGVLHKRGAAALKESHGVSLDTIIQLRNQALALDSAFVAWEAAHERDFYPNTIFHIRESSESMRTHYPVGLWPGKVDTYFDHYIAGIWNLYRASRVSLQDIILKFSDVLNDGRSLEAENMVADFLVEDMLSSIPFHLTENLHDFSREITKGVNNIHNPGRSIGGLLLMHSIMATSHLEIVDVKIRIYLRDCLRWIGEHMGIGQASILAEVRSHLFLSFHSMPMLSNPTNLLVVSNHRAGVFWRQFDDYSSWFDIVNQL